MLIQKEKNKTAGDVIKWEYVPRYWPFVRGIHYDVTAMISLFCMKSFEFSLQFDLILFLMAPLTIYLQSFKYWPQWDHTTGQFRVVSPHCSDVIMSAMASQITGVSIVHSTICSAADQRKHQSSASLAYVRGIHRWPVNSPHKGPVTRKMFSFDDVIMVLLRQKFTWAFKIPWWFSVCNIPTQILN